MIHLIVTQLKKTIVAPCQQRKQPNYAQCRALEALPCPRTHSRHGKNLGILGGRQNVALILQRFCDGNQVGISPAS